MKENPAMQKIMDNMKPGVISLHGFLGDDKRDIELIVDHDEATLQELGFTASEAADALEHIRDKASEGLGNYIALKNGYMAKVDSIRGKMPCPYVHKGLYRKTVTSLRGPGIDGELMFTDLGIHMIREHGFFEGKGSSFRLEPELLFNIINKLEL